MKKILLTIVLIMALCLGGCSLNKNPLKDKSSAQTSKSTSYSSEWETPRVPI